MCLKVADDIELFKHVGTQSSPAKNIDTLAGLTSVEPTLLKRVVQHLAARNVLVDSASATDEYGATHISEALATREGSSGVRHAWNIYMPAFLELPQFLKKNGYQAHTDSRNGIFQQSHNLTGLTMFECLHKPEYKPRVEDFNLLMSFTMKARPSFMNVCDMRSLIQKQKPNPQESKHFFVDIGGATGTDAADVRDRFNDVAGVVELQELTGVVEAARATDVESRGVTLRAHDFFTPQPVLGSRFYYLSAVLHKWPDADAKRILENIAAAMVRGYSTLLVSENVVPDSKCPPHVCALDLTMMTMFASKERNEKEWKQLLESAGLKIVKIHTSPSSLKSVLECELK